ncbi:MAG: hypothetical protein IT377_02580 [Polyangiaceae bacterium]|nr:hypothetical protein [Polyangiaceae bacterium]
MSQLDLIGVIESAYRTDLPDKEWLGGVAHAARGQLDAGFGVGAWTFDARDLTRIRVLDTALSGDDPRVFDLMHQCNGILESRARDLRAEVHRHGPCQTFSEVLGADTIANQTEVNGLLGLVGARDMLSIIGADPSGMGLGVGALLPATRGATRSEVHRWSRVVAHLAAGYRLRRTLAERPVAAVLSPSGQTLHAEPSAQPREVREALRRAAASADRARGRLRREDVDEAVESWRGLVAGRFTLVDQFESDGRRFVVARQNDPETPFPPNLTQRERQVLMYRALGHPLKLIGYELGLGTSTVSVALSSALAKLGVGSVTDVIRFLMPGGDS